MASAFWPALTTTTRSSWLPIISGTAYLLVYLYLTDLFYRANRRRRVTGLLQRNGPLDLGSSVLLVAVTALLMAHVVYLGVQGDLTFRFLLSYYFLFIVLYAGIFGLLDPSSNVWLSACRP